MSLRTMLPRAASGWAPTAGPSSLVRSAPRPSSSSHPSVLQLRFRGDLAPRRVKYRKAFKGSVPVRTGGSLKGTTLEIGEFGIRTKQPCRLSAKVLKGCETAIKKGLKSVKEAQCYLRVFPQIPVCVKGNETRMGKGKGAFEYWACRAPVGRVLFEVGGGGVQREVAFAALRLAQPKIPVVTELIDRTAQARLGGMLLDRPGKEPAEAVKSREEEVLDGMLEKVREMGLERDRESAKKPVAVAREAPLAAGAAPASQPSP